MISLIAQQSFGMRHQHARRNSRVLAHCVNAGNLTVLGDWAATSASVAAVCAHGNVILRVNSAVTLAFVATPNKG